MSDENLKALAAAYKDFKKNGPGKKPIPASIKNDARKLWKSGIPQKQLAEAIGISLMGLRAWFKDNKKSKKKSAGIKKKKRKMMPVDNKIKSKSKTVRNIDRGNVIQLKIGNTFVEGTPQDLIQLLKAM